MSVHYVQRMVNLELKDYRIIQSCAEEFGLGSRSFSAALRLIVREWSFLRKAYLRAMETQAPGGLAPGYRLEQSAGQPIPPVQDHPGLEERPES